MSPIRALRFALPVIAVMAFVFTLPAQERGSVEIVVRNQAGDSLPFARIRATGNGSNISTSANTRGRTTISVPYGTVKISVSTLGYESLERNVTVNQPSSVQEFVLKAVARQLSDVEVRAKYIGIRGGIADEVTRKPLAGVAVTSKFLNVSIVTDSNGRFEIPMAKASSMVLQLAKEGYQIRPAQVDVRDDGPSDVIFFMSPGTNIRGERTRLTELDRRARANRFYGFTVSGAALQETKMKSLYDAIVSSGILMKNKMQMGDKMCLFVNGLPRPEFPLSAVYVPNIDFIEVYGQKSENTNSLMPEWPSKIPCESHELAHGLPTVRASCRCIVAIVSVWTHKPSAVADDSVRYDLNFR